MGRIWSLMQLIWSNFYWIFIMSMKLVIRITHSKMLGGMKVPKKRKRRIIYWLMLLKGVWPVSEKYSHLKIYH